MTNLFDVIPSGFFICLSSGSNHKIYADCLQIIYEQYDREISYRIARSRIRDALAVYLLENHVDFIEDREEKQRLTTLYPIGYGRCCLFCNRDSTKTDWLFAPLLHFHYRNFFTTMGSADFSQFVAFSQLISRSLALYVISVRRTRGLLTASFRFHFTMNTLAVQLYTSHYLGVFGTYTR